MGILEVMLSLVMALDSFLLKLSSPRYGSLVLRDSDCLNDSFRFRPGEIDGQQSVLQVRPQHLHSVREHEGALELARRDAAVEVLPGLVVLLPAANDELAFLDRDVELVAVEARDRQRDAQPFRLAVLAGNPLDIVGRIPVRRLRDPIERTLDLVEAEQEGTGQRRNTRHGLKVLR